MQLTAVAQVRRVDANLAAIVAASGMGIAPPLPGVLLWEDRRIEVALDRVEGLGSFVELELIAEQAGLESARQCVTSAAARLGLSETERRSYLEMLLAAAGHENAGRGIS